MPVREKTKGLLTQLPTIVALIFLGLIARQAFDVLVTKNTPSEPEATVETDEDAKSAAAKAIPSKADRKVFSKSLLLLAELIEKDGKQKEPSIKTTDQVSEEIVGFVVRSFLLSGGKAEFESLKTILVEAFDEEKEFPQKAIDLDEESRARAVTQLTLLSSTFE